MDLLGTFKVPKLSILTTNPPKHCYCLNKDILLLLHCGLTASQHQAHYANSTDSTKLYTLENNLDYDIRYFHTPDIMKDFFDLLESCV